MHLHDNVELVSWSIEQLEAEIIDPLTEPIRIRLMQLFSEEKFANDAPDGRLREGTYPDVQWRVLKDKMSHHRDESSALTDLAELLHKQTSSDGDEENPSQQVMRVVL